MKSRIFSSKYIKTISKGQAWIPAFITLGFLLAFPVAALVKLGTWRNVEYTTAQISVLYNHLWRDGLVMTGMVRFLSWTADEAFGNVCRKSGSGTDLLCDSLCSHGIFHDLYRGSQRIFQPEDYGNGS